ncbi:FAD-dependent monooxygenase [Chryseobacterium sp. JUb7]|uniref:FAD-dependent monooxygenase n=1 Tax=Chryseobacterium sp. JUb7 TaxID=2940599 RepID=UPI002169FEEA|nr:FAD-dependent monooxygenase [Chryseobacterium sp. JUb7]MCS3528882.1 2-polyprenyl-6-methoxyphenol hydroxylase-like FAD-dependent oxidoreductase [Chryseobacterium sp. JUb7]
MNSISIIGAGIGGLTLGNILKQYNIDFTVYESAPEIKPVGSGIMMAINAMQVFDTLGLKEKIEKAGNKIHGISITDENLKLISKTNVLELEKKYNSCNVAIHRADLQRILAEKIGFENIKLNHSLKEIKKQENYLLQFENGNEVESKIIFGADGIHSKIRNQIFKTGEIRHTQQMCWRGLVDFDLPEKFYQEAIETWGKGKRFGFVRMTDRKIYWYAVINKGRHKRYHSLSENFQGFHPLIIEIIESTLEENIIFNDIIDLSPIPTWHTQNLCLIGDAAHATTPNLGQGACQAIEDSYIIGKLLGDNKDFNTIFKEFQQIRKKKVDHVVDTSWKLGKFSQWEKGTRLRNLMMRLVPESIHQKMVEKVIKLEI